MTTCISAFCLLASFAAAQERPGPELVVDGNLHLAAGVASRIPIDFFDHGHAITALAFSLDLDLDRLDFDPTDGDGDGVPDAVSFLPGAPSLAFVRFDAADGDGELDILLANLSGLPLEDGLRLEVELLATEGGQVAELVRYSEDPRPSFGNDLGEDVPGRGVVTGVCSPGPSTACLLDGRFQVEGTMMDFSSPPRQVAARVMGFAGARAESDQAVFFHSFRPGNFEIGVKMVDACGLPAEHPLRAFWAFFGGLTNTETRIEIEDTVTGQIYRWFNPAGEFPVTLGDTGSFPCIGGVPGDRCQRDGNTACLLGGRFKVTGTMEDFGDPPVEHPVAAMAFSEGRAESDQAVFFEAFQPGNFEIGVKMVDGCVLPEGHPLRSFWVFYGALTNTETEVRVTQLSTGRVDTWSNPAGEFPQTVGRTGAFPCED